MLDPGEPLVESEVPVSEAFVVDPETLKHRGVQVIYVDGVFHDVVGEVAGFRLKPAWIPPAIHMEKQRPWWSRP